MLNIHSFLQGIKQNLSGVIEKCHKTTLLLVGYCLVACIILLSSSFTKVEGTKVIEAFAKSNEETAKKANIRADQEDEKTNVEDTTSGIMSLGAINSMAVEATNVAYDEQQQEVIEDDRAQRLAQDKEIRAEKAEAAKEAKEAAAKKAEEERKANHSTSLSTSEKEVLQRIVEAEATGEDLKGRILVANVILNRVKSEQFPDTVKGVVFQKDGDSVQFSPTKDGRYWSVTVSKQTKQAVEEALAGTDYSKGALYFSARSKADPSNMSWFDTHLTWLLQYGGHEFYK